MSLAFYITEGVHWWGGNFKRYDLPSEETLLLLEASYMKKKAFKAKAARVIAVDDMVIEEGNEQHVNAVTIRLGSEKYFCDEYTYFNSLLAKESDLDYYQREEFEKRNKNLTLEKYKTFSRPLNRGVSKTGNAFVENDTGSCSGSDGYRGHMLNLYGCLIKLLEALPENTLIERNKYARNEYGNPDDSGPFAELFNYCEWEPPKFWFGFTNYNGIDEYAKAEEYEVFCKLAERIKHLCEEKNIYFDYNGYDSIVIDKEPMKSRKGNDDEGQRIIYTKYKDTYMDGHVEYHEEGVAIEIVERRLKSKSSYYSRKYDHITEVYDVVYVDGVIGQIVKKYTEYAD